jgi:hypothetical protein
VYAERWSRCPIALVGRPFATSSVTRRSRSVSPYVSAIRGASSGGWASSISTTTEESGLSPRTESRTTPTAVCGTNTRPGKGVGPRFPPVGISLIIAGEAPRQCRHGKHGNRQIPTQIVTGGKFIEQAISPRGGHVDGVVRAEYDHAGPTLVGCRHLIEDRGGGPRPLVHHRAFAQLAGVTLRHYDSLGLLVPSFVDPVTGHRHYEATQLSRTAGPQYRRFGTVLSTIVSCRFPRIASRRCCSSVPNHGATRQPHGRLSSRHDLSSIRAMGKD